MEILRAMKPCEQGEVGELIFKSTNTWYINNGKTAVFQCSPEETSFFCEVYESMDPGCCLVVEIDDQIVASCFYHPRQTHYSLGIMCVHPKFYGRGLARKILNEIIRLAKDADKPLNLISSAMNLDSFSLYNKSGFVPLNLFQDMIIPVPESGRNYSIPENIRPAKSDDVERIVSLEFKIHGQEHRKDLQLIVSDKSGVWNCNIVEEKGEITGFLCSVNHPSSRIIGLGAAGSSKAIFSLIKSHLNYFRGESPLIIVPCSEKELVQNLFKLGGRNLELHMTQTLADEIPELPLGVVIPTFMPE